MINLLKYTLNEVYQNKARLLIFMLIYVTAVVTIYTMLTTLLLNYNNSSIPDVIKEKDIINMMYMPKNTGEEESEEMYRNLIDDLSASKFSENSFQYIDMEFLSTSDRRLTFGEPAMFNTDNKLKLYNLNGIIASPDILEVTPFEVDFLTGESFDSFSGNKVLIPESFNELYKLGSIIEIYTPYYVSEGNNNIVEATNYTVVGYIDKSAKMFSPTMLENIALEDEFIIPDIKFEDYTYNNSENSFVLSTMISGTYYFVDNSDVESLTEDITRISKDNDALILTTNYTNTIKLQDIAYIQVLKNNLLISVPTLILFIIALQFSINQLIKSRYKFLSIVSMLGGSASFIKSIYVSILFILNILSVILVNFVVNLNEIDVEYKLLIISSILTLIISVIVTVFCLRTIKTKNLGKVMKSI